MYNVFSFFFTKIAYSLMEIQRALYSLNLTMKRVYDI